jgi:L-cysteine:1D-myo-inositol 2-amino-2-deoxy-alpha-D-glucopyranoside ligase
MWTEKLLSDAKEFLDSLCLQISQVDCAPTDQVIQKMINSLANNLDTPGVITILKDWIKQSQNGETGGNPGELSRAIDSFLGIAI